MKYGGNFSDEWLRPTQLPLDSLAAILGVERVWLLSRAEDGLLPGLVKNSEGFTYSSALVQRIRRMHRLERDFEAVPELAALVADLFEELDRLRTQIGSRLTDGSQV